MTKDFEGGSQTIAAVATGMARTAIGILRLSGDAAIPALSAVFHPDSGRSLSDYPPRQLVYGTLCDRDGNPIDKALATLSRAPHSYTGEDTAEVQCHGSPRLLTLGLEAIFAQGVRQATAGEFTRRAYLNGRLDLPQAEAVADLIDAETPSAVRHAAGQLSGALSRRVGAIYDELVDLMAHFCAVLDYSDEDLDPFRTETIQKSLAHAAEALERLLASYDRGRHAVGGVPCAIVGRPNAGKSSLLNALLGYDRAIVTALPGTTRDTIEEKAELGGVLLRLIDTAGLRETGDEIERLGVARSRAALAGADLALVLIDGSLPPNPEDLAVLRAAQAAVPQVLLLRTKSDLGPAEGSLSSLGQDALPESLSVSAKTGAGLDALSAAVAERFPQGAPEEAGELLTNARQAEAAGRALDGVLRAQSALSAGITPDAVLTDVEEALAALGELTGKTVRSDITARIFQRFCVGK
ncbi:MAG: tRNA uridine-5-carboxymethylaminomethyl(34) synthesis GTPase MnmE [Pseudoflavonifractor sp.]